MADSLANRYRVLADAAGKDQRIQPAKGGGERTQLAPNAIAEKIDRELCARLIACQQCAHVARHARHAQQAGLMIQQCFDGAGVEL